MIFSDSSIIFGNIKDIYIEDYILFDNFDYYLYYKLKKQEHKNIVFIKDKIFSYDDNIIKIVSQNKKNIQNGPLGNILLDKKTNIFFDEKVKIQSFLELLENKNNKITLVIYLEDILAKFDSNYLNIFFTKLIEENNHKVFFVMDVDSKNEIKKIIQEKNLSFLTLMKKVKEFQLPKEDVILSFFNYFRLKNNKELNYETIETEIKKIVDLKSKLSDILIKN